MEEWTLQKQEGGKKWQEGRVRLKTGNEGGGTEKKEKCLDKQGGQPTLAFADLKYSDGSRF